jgi:hypothetical protein
MAKLDLTFEHFAREAKLNGFVPELQGNSTYFIKVGEHKVKTELNTHAGTYVVGAGLKSELLDMLATHLTTGETPFTLVRKAKGWAIFDFESLERFFILAKRINNTPFPAKEVKVKVTKEKVAKEPKIKLGKEKVKKEKAEKPVRSPEELERIKAANLARLKAVGEKYKGRVAQPHGETYGETDPELQKLVVSELEELNDTDRVPQFLTQDEVKAIV